MSREELIKILEDYEIFVDDDFGGSYKSIIAYTPDKKVSRAHTPIGTLEIIDEFEKMQKENEELKNKLKFVDDYVNKQLDRFDKQPSATGIRMMRNIKKILGGKLYGIIE